MHVWCRIWLGVIVVFGIGILLEVQAEAELSSESSSRTSVTSVTSSEHGKVGEVYIEKDGEARIQWNERIYKLVLDDEQHQQNIHTIPTQTNVDEKNIKDTKHEAQHTKETTKDTRHSKGTMQNKIT
jgi:hypothetical protein